MGNDDSFGMDWTDKRSLADLRFGDVFPEAERAEVDGQVHQILADLGVQIAEDIKKIGCTTLAARGIVGRGGETTITLGRFLRQGLGGCGIGLTCFVPPDRFCLVHETHGGLQDAQVPLDAEATPLVSRELTDAERAEYGRVAAVREMEHATDRERIDMLAGKRRLPQDDEPTAPAPAPALTASSEAARFMCDEHPKTDWSCRRCVAEAIVDGSLVPTLLLVWGDNGSELDNVTAKELDEKLKQLNENGEESCAVYVKAARWTRRLAREE